MIKLSDYVIKRLEETGSKHMFMLPGGGAMHLNDSLGKSKNIKYVPCLHEQACAIAAESYARVTNTPGLLMVTTGPGGTNALTGVAGAYIESTPMMVISGQVKRLDMINDQNIRQQGMQEVDIVSIVKPITKYAVCVKEPNEIKYHLDKAIYEAMHDRKGPVWIDIPLDVQATMIDEDALEGYVAKDDDMYYSKKLEIEKKVLDVIDKINSSDRPVILIGNGIRLADAISEWDELKDILDIPILTTWNGIDLIDDNDSMYFGRPGGLGHRYANFIQQNSDLFLSIGARLNLLQTGYNFDGFCREAYKIMVDIDENELCKINVRPDMKICSDAKLFLELMLKNKEKIKVRSHDIKRKEWLEYCHRLKAKYDIKDNVYKNIKDKVNTYYLIDAISDVMKKDDIYVSGSSGSCIDISMQGFKVKKGQRVYCTKGLASMGYGLPSCIGASLASGKKKVLSMQGDGGFVMNIQDLETIKRENLPIKIFVLSNGGYGAIRATQTHVFDGHYVDCDRSSGLSMPDLVKVCKAFDIETITIKNNNEIKEKVEYAYSSYGPMIIICNTPIELTALPKQVSYKRSDGQMESLPLEYMHPELSDEEMKENMIISIYEKK